MNAARGQPSDWLIAMAAPILAAYRDDILAPFAPVIGRLALAACLVIGVFTGLMDRNGLPYTANLGALAVLAVLPILSGRLGLAAFAGFVLADLYAVTGDPSNQVTGFYLLGVLSSWFFLLQLLALLPVAARQLAWFRGGLARLNGLISTLLITGFVEIWTRLAIVALRPLYTWRGHDVPLELTSFADPVNEWALGPVVLHQLAWVAAATGLLRWLTDIAVHVLRPEPRAALPSRASHSSLPVPWWARAMGKAGITTATLAGVFASIPGAIAFWLAIAGAIAVRSLASASRLVARWDGWMLAIPAALRLIAGYLLCFYLAEPLIGLFRGAFEWRTMTTTGFVIIIVFAASLIFWPQVAPGQPAPAVPPALDRLFKGAANVSPGIAFLAMMVLSTAAHAHHCSFEPGCECLTDDAALAALIAGGATWAQLNTVRFGLDANADLPGLTDMRVAGSTPSVGVWPEYMKRVEFWRTANLAGDFGNLLKQANEIADLLNYLKSLQNVDDLEQALSWLGTNLGSNVSPADMARIRADIEANALAAAGQILVGKLIDMRYDQYEREGIVPPIPREVSKSLAETLVNAVSLNLSGEIIGKGFAIADSYADVALQNAELVAATAAVSVMNLDLFASGNLSYDTIQLKIGEIRQIAMRLASADGAVFDGTMFNNSTAERLTIIADLTDLRLRQLNGQPNADSYQSALLSRYGGSGFAADFAAELGIRGWKSS